jgi:uncharacterized Tic20 family protein
MPRMLFVISVSDVDVIDVEPTSIYDHEGKPIKEFDRDAQNWAMICHLSALVGLLGIPLLHILAPLAVWLFKRNDYPFVNDQGKEALNFQITMGLIGLIGWALTLIFVGWILLILLLAINFVFVLSAALKVNQGDPYRYPFSLRLIR